MSNKKFLLIWLPILVFFTVLLLVLNIALNIGSKWVSSQFGSGTYEVINAPEAENWDTEYYKSDYDSVEDVDAAARDLVSEIAGEGIVLVKHENEALPLASGAKVTMLGRTAADPVYGGSGSGYVDTSTAVNARGGLENAGFEVNDAVFEALSEFAGENARGFIEMDLPDDSTYNIGEMPVSGYDVVSSSFADYSDAALVYIGRPGGEGGDLTQNMEGWDDNFEPGQHQLELNKDEKDLLQLATDNFETVVVLVNSSTSMEMGPIQDNPDIDSVLLIGSPGASGFNAVGDILAGEISPPGRTVAQCAARFSSG